MDFLIIHSFFFELTPLFLSDFFEWRNHNNYSYGFSVQDDAFPLKMLNKCLSILLITDMSHS